MFGINVFLTAFILVIFVRFTVDMLRLMGVEIEVDTPWGVKMTYNLLRLVVIFWAWQLLPWKF